MFKSSIRRRRPLDHFMNGYWASGQQFVALGEGEQAHDAAGSTAAARRFW